MVSPGNLYILSKGKWVSINTKNVVKLRHRYENNLDKISEVLIIAITRFDIGNKYIKFGNKERRLLEIIAYHIVSKTIIEWLPKTNTNHTYYACDYKIIIKSKDTTDTLIFPEYTKNYSFVLQNSFKYQIESNKSDGNNIFPKSHYLVISPATTPVTLRSPIPQNNINSSLTLVALDILQKKSQICNIKLPLITKLSTISELNK